MRTADTVLSIIRTRGTQGLPLERIQRLLYNRDLYLRAYARLYPNKGAMTPGSTPETVDGMSVRKIDQLIDDIRHRRFRWTPVRRTYIAKANGQWWPLSLPTWRDKLLQEVIRSILEAYYEPLFSPHSHGFRPGHGCHSALIEVQKQWTGTRWFIEGDLSQYFDTISHEVLLQILGEKLHDKRFLQVLAELLQAGYMEDWQYHRTLSGVPQGGVVSPILSNIYLDRLDQYVETMLIPAYTRGKQRRTNPPYNRIGEKLHRLRRAGKKEAAKQLRKQLQTLPSYDPHDPHYRRLHYVRYADDWLLGFAGPRQEAEEIKTAIAGYLRDNLKLTLSDEKTLITHASTEAARFLGYGIVNQQDNSMHTAQRRSINGRIGLRVPASVVRKTCARYARKGKITHRTELLEDSDYSIVARYQQEYRGTVQYYLLAYNVSTLSRLHWVMEQSLLKTLARKHKTRMAVLRAKYRATTQTAEGKTRRCLEVRVERAGKEPLVARFGGIALARQPSAILNEIPYVNKGGRTELLKRLLADTCELCGSNENVEVHHIRKLADVMKHKGKIPPAWAQQMAARRRKTLVVCRTCHVAIHAGRPTRQPKPK
jgi:group II intron reverse transcriptase/maturase